MQSRRNVTHVIDVKVVQHIMLSLFLTFVVTIAIVNMYSLKKKTNVYTFGWIQQTIFLIKIHFEDLIHFIAWISQKTHIDYELFEEENSFIFIIPMSEVLAISVAILVESLLSIKLIKRLFSLYTIQVVYISLKDQFKNFLSILKLHVYQSFSYFIF